MSVTLKQHGLAETVVDTLRAHRDSLQARGIRHLALFGSVARGEDTHTSDIDLMAELDPDARIGLIGVVGLERELAELLGRPVDLITGPSRRPQFNDNVQRDSRIVF